MANQNAKNNYKKRETFEPFEFRDMGIDSLQYLREQPYYIVDLPPTIKCILPPKFLEEEPLLVNPKQYERIIKRRIARTKPIRDKKANKQEEKQAKTLEKQFKTEEKSMKADEKLEESEVKHSEDKSSKTYKHESRHLHACKRQRSTGGTFLPKEGEGKTKKKVKYSKYSAACVIYGHPPDN